MFSKIIFTKLDKTNYPPKEKPVMAWDGNCGFCHYWVLRWKKLSGDVIEYRPFSEVAKRFPDIEYKYFQQALRFIDTDGRIYTGPAAAFRSFQYGPKYHWILKLYENFKPAEWFADHFYSFVSRRRPQMYKITVRLWGKNPVRQKNYWLYYLGGLSALVAGIILLI
ncbi:MAG: DCC1-like thiol-disulfide oxidoreductase family protein [Bacteroidales bacterium]|nr:DCC1-like thiol-disulfide oxidoreductase family protein [Bacteroidales bacterium]NLM92762.1 DUF393 domain-containing protein [Bacteroidales bacterium]